MKVNNQSFTAMILALVVGFATMAQTVYAAPVETPDSMVSTQQLLHDLQLQQQQATVSEFLARDDVQKQLIERGVDPALAMERVGGMSAGELAELSANIENLPAGAGILETALFLLVIFMLLDIAGVTDIFPGL